MTTDDNHDVFTKNQSEIEGELELTREEVRAIKKMCEDRIREEGKDFGLGGSNWADLMDIRTKCKSWLVSNQTK